ncbi:MAG: hypothetical protein MRECE_7c008 [Mycoplasmataceae bacterium CE_OT135]|nr:MAG: hypothetical protein MRECE_7c008 [Mycoplasmataceae bacterium CE_OT135]
MTHLNQLAKTKNTSPHYWLVRQGWVRLSLALILLVRRGEENNLFSWQINLTYQPGK